VNRWKIAFFGLAAIVISAIIIIVALLLQGDEQEVTYEPPANDGKPIFFVQTSKERLNDYVQSQLQSLTYDRDNFDFTVELHEHVHVDGFLTVFDQKLNFRMQLKPIVQPDGNLLLQQQSFYIGELPIPSKQVLKTIRSSVKLPKWIDVTPNKGAIYINFEKMKVNGHLHIKVKKLDLRNDDLLFEIYER